MTCDSCGWQIFSPKDSCTPRRSALSKAVIIVSRCIAISIMIFVLFVGEVIISGNHSLSFVGEVIIWRGNLLFVGEVIITNAGEVIQVLLGKPSFLQKYYVINLAQFLNIRYRVFNTSAIVRYCW